MPISMYRLRFEMKHFWKKLTNKMDIASIVFLLIWPGLPLVLIGWGYMDARDAQQEIDGLQAKTIGTVIQSFTFTDGELDVHHEDSRRQALSLWLQYEVNGKTYKGGEFAPRGVFPWSERSTGMAATAEKYVVGETYPLWYDPAHPEKAYIVKSSKWDHAGKLKWGLYILLGIALMLGMLLWLSK